MPTFSPVLTSRFAAPLLASAILLVGGITAAHAQATISTYPSWNGSSQVATWGTPDTQTYGQTFSRPDGTNVNLDSFQVSIKKVTAGTPNVDYQAYLFAWNGTDITGSALYTSVVHNTLTTDGITAAGFTNVTFTTGGVSLGSGQYAILFSMLGQGNANGAAFAFGDVGGFGNTGAAYAGGKFIYSNVNTKAGLAANPNWNNNGDFGDLAFKANFSPSAVAATPEPGAIVTGLSMVGMTGLGLVRGRRRRKTAA